MIARMWRGRAKPGSEAAYVSHLETSVFPEIRALAGNRGAQVLQGTAGHERDFVVLTFWTDLDAVSAFAGADVNVAVVPVEAQELLSEYDSHVEHFEVVSALSEEPDDE